MATPDLSSLTSVNSLCGYVVLACVPIAVSAGDPRTQYIAGALAVLFGAGFVVTTAGRGEAILAKDVARLPLDKPIHPTDLVDPTPPPEKKTEHDHLIAADPRDTSTNLGLQRPPPR